MTVGGGEFVIYWLPRKDWERGH